MKTLRIIKRLNRKKMRVIREAKLTEVSLLSNGTYGMGYQYARQHPINFDRLVKMSHNNLFRNQYSTVRYDGGGYVIQSLRWFKNKKRNEQAIRNI